MPLYYRPAEMAEWMGFGPTMVSRDMGVRLASTRPLRKNLAEAPGLEPGPFSLTVRSTANYTTVQ